MAGGELNYTYEGAARGRADVLSYHGSVLVVYLLPYELELI